MKNRVQVLVAVLSLTLLIGSLCAYAAPMPNELTAKVPFQFMVGDKMLPAGAYVVEGQGAAEMKIRALKGEWTATAPVITRLAKENHSEHGTKVNLVFDIVGDKHYLSEVWMPGQDGYLVRGTTESHTHAVVAENNK